MKDIYLPFVYHNNNFAYIEDGMIKHIIMERYTKVKYDFLDKKRREKFLLKLYKKSKIITSFKPFNFNYFKLTDIFHRITYSSFFDIKSRMYLDHHLAHAYLGYVQNIMINNIQETDILVWDGVGERYTTLFIDKFGRIFNVNIPIGQLWNQISSYVFGCCSEGKGMGLSAYGEITKKYLDIFKQIYKIKFEPYQYQKFYLDFKDKIMSKLVDELNNWELVKNVFASLQYFTNQVISEIISAFKSCDNIVISGGGAYNCYINTLLFDYYKTVYVPPQPGDEGLSVGLLLYDLYLDKRLKDITKNFAFLGSTSYDFDYSVFKDFNIFFFKDKKKLIRDIISLLKQNKILAIYNGRSESGKRALGNRSIIANPETLNIRDKLNELKKREKWRPFGITILENVSDMFFNSKIKSPYMSFIDKNKQNKYKEVIHIDGSTRFQTIVHDFNPFFYNIIVEFYNATNIPFVINTSLNMSGKPLVEDLSDLLEFKKNNPDVILVVNEQYLVT